MNSKEHTHKKRFGLKKFERLWNGKKQMPGYFENTEMFNERPEEIEREKSRSGEMLEER